MEQNIKLLGEKELLSYQENYYRCSNIFVNLKFKLIVEYIDQKGDRRG